MKKLGRGRKEAREDREEAREAREEDRRTRKESREAAKRISRWPKVNPAPLREKPAGEGRLAKRQGNRFFPHAALT